ncbi:rhodanese-like domain-containing protein [Terribacillus sp. AE2B 122]|uniref:rhodanese-like domain-containing protein n=1 Tax=Terribacillus sp. AE2B 122 TaxID=1331902 RepID=UPI0015836F53|nr:rhodanese-like domain-containing protein [Terribacillus sp. AE2B 122]
MEYILYILVALIIYFVIRNRFSNKAAKQISTAELKGILNDKNKQFIDVRTSGEYNAKHIKQFKNIPLHELKSKASSLNQNKEVVVICQSGMRGSQAAKVLKKMGFNSITNVRGGMNTWR